MPWPAYLFPTDTPREGTCYIRKYAMPAMIERYKPRGQAWKYGRQWTTYQVNRRLAFKNADRIDARNEQDFWAIMREAQHAGLANPPTSFADLFSDVYRGPMPRISTRSPFYGFSFGGWEQIFERGELAGRIYQYDLNKAYRWAACCGLPNLRDGFFTRDFTRENAIYLIRVHGNEGIPYAPGRGLRIITSEERNAMPWLQSASVIGGVAFRSEIDLSSVFQELDARFPHAAARVSQRFWGLWNTAKAPEQWSWAKGERFRRMSNPFYNPVWSAFITSRVKLRMLAWSRVAIRIYVDSIMSREQLPTGPEIGDFKLVGEYDNVWMRAPGHWGCGSETMRQSGIRRAAGLIQELRDRKEDFSSWRN